MRKLIAAVLAAGLVLAWCGGSRAQEARDIIARAVKAHGGEANFARCKAVRAATKGTAFLDGLTFTVTTETFSQWPYQGRSVGVVKSNLGTDAFTFVVNGAKGWTSFNGETKPLSEATLAYFKEGLYAQHVASLVPLLREKSFRLTALGESKVKGQAVQGVEVAAAGQRTIRLYFARDSGRLLKREWRGRDSAGKGDVFREEHFSDHRRTGGLLMPWETRTYEDGRLVNESRVVELEVLEKRLPEKTFARP
jgi:hypothetical protein